MLISTSHSFVLFCMTKCASNSIEKTLAPYSDIRLRGLPEVRHTDYRTFERYIAPYLRKAVPVRDLVVKYMRAKTGARLKLGCRNVSPGERRSAKLVERIARIRRLLQERRRVRRVAHGVQSFNIGDGLPGDLARQLRAHIPRDFELYEMAIRRSQHTPLYADDQRAAERCGG
jgi:hypothetical protein